MLQDPNIETMNDMMLALKIKKNELAENICDEESEATLAALTVFGYSLEFWNNAMCDEGNPWHNIMVSYANNSGCEKALVGKLWKWFKEKVWNPIRETVTDILAITFNTAVCDGIGFLSGGLKGFALSKVWLGIYTAGCSAIGLIGGIKHVCH